MNWPKSLHGLNISNAKIKMRKKQLSKIAQKIINGGETFLSHCSIHQNRFTLCFLGLIMFVNFKQKKGSYNCSLGNQLTIFCVLFLN